MIEKKPHNETKNIEIEETQKQHSEEVKKYHKASVYEYTPDSNEEQRFLDWEKSFDKKIQKEKIAEKSSTHEKKNSPDQNKNTLNDAPGRIQQIISIIDSIEILPEFSKDEDMKKTLAENKITAKNLIKDLLTKDVREYINLVQSFDKSRAGVQTQTITADEFKEFDQRRGIKHNALMSSINIVNRFIAQKFGVMSDEDLDMYEEREEKAGREVAQVKRVPLPKNIICPNYIDLSVREDITDWAIDIARSLPELAL